MISINNLSFAFKKGKPLFSNLSLDLEPGTIYGLFGLNGAGKTTLLSHMSGMLFPDSGTCTLNGVSARDRSPKMMSNLFLVPEQFTLPSMTGHEYVQLHAPFYPGFDMEMMESSIDTFNVDQSSALQELSYGQQKKFMIAFALATNTSVLLMDEPTNGLDIPSKSQFRKIVASLDYSDRCIVISTHQVRDLGAMIDQVSIIKHGDIIFNQSLNTVRETLRFTKISQDDDLTYLYGEETLGGMNAICGANQNQAHSRDSGELDLELLFNGIITNTELFQDEFKKVSV